MSSSQKVVDLSRLLIPVKHLSQGGYGSLLLVRDKQNPKVMFVLKALRRGDIKQLVQQHHKLKAVQKLCKKYFVCSHGLARWGPMNVLVMDYLDGYVDLFDFLTDKTFASKKTFDNLVTIAKNLLKGIKALHALNVAHRDIKPENIMINPTTLETRYIDFGSACVGDEHCRTQPIHVGTRGYMAPEIVLQKKKNMSLKDTQLTDLFSLGIVIGLLFTKNNVNPIERLMFDMGYRRADLQSYKAFFSQIQKEGSDVFDAFNTSLVRQPLKTQGVNLLSFDPHQRRLTPRPHVTIVPKKKKAHSV